MSVGNGGNLANYLSSTAGLPSLDTSTITFWVKLLADTGTDIYVDTFGLTDGTSGGEVIYIDPVREVRYGFPNEADFGTGFTIALNTWTQLAFVADGTAGQHEVMWRALGGGSMSTTGRISTVSSFDPTILQLLRSTFSEATRSMIVERFRAFNIALSPAQVLAEGNSATPVITGADLNRNIALTNNGDLADTSGNGRNFTANGTITTSSDSPFGPGTQTVSPSGLASSAVFGSQTVIDVNPTAAPSGLGSAAVFGTHALANVAARTLQPSGLGSAAVFGTHSLASVQTQNILHTGKSSAAVFGSHTFANVAARTLQPAGKSSAAVFGSHTLNKEAISQGVPSAAVFGGLVLTQEDTTTLTMTGKASNVVYGAHTFANVAAQNLSVPGKTSMAATGSHTLGIDQADLISPAGKSSAAVFGTHAIALTIDQISGFAPVSANLTGFPTLLGGAQPVIPTGGGGGFSGGARAARARAFQAAFKNRMRK
jgi:hypothetical protein